MAVAMKTGGRIESLLSAVVADGMIGSRHKSNFELVAQGLANIGSGLFGGMPAIPVSARGRLEALPGVEVIAVPPSILVVRSTEPLAPRPLVELSAALREAWLQGMPDDREA